MVSANDNFAESDTTKIYQLYEEALKIENDLLKAKALITVIKLALPHYVQTKTCANIIFNSFNRIDELYTKNQQESLRVKFYEKLLNNPALDKQFKTFCFRNILTLDNNYLEQSNNKTSLIQLLKALLNEKRYPDLSRLVLSVGNYYYDKGNYKNSLIFYQLAYRFFKVNSDVIGVSKALNNIAIVNIYLKNYDEAEKYLKESLQLKNQLNDEKGKAAVYGNLSMIYAEKLSLSLDNNKDSANFYKEKYLCYFNLSKQIDSTFGNSNGIMTSILNDANVFIDTKEYTKALDCYKIIKQHIDQNPHETDIKLYYCINASNLYIQLSEDVALSENQQNKYLLQAKKLLEQASVLCKDYNITNYYPYIYEHLYKINKMLNNCPEALHYCYLWKVTKDSITNTEQINYLNTLEKRFQNRQNQEKISYLEKERTLLNNQRNLIFGFSVLFIVGLILLVYQIYQRFRITKRHNQFITEQKEKIEKVNKELNEKNDFICQSIDYIKYIQQSFLVQENDLKLYFADAFITYKPKEELSGDFYIYKERI